MFKKVFIIIFAAFFIFCEGICKSAADSGELKIRFNQIGFYPDAQKIAVVLTDKGQDFSFHTSNKKTVFNGTLKRSLTA